MAVEKPQDAGQKSAGPPKDGPGRDVRRAEASLARAEEAVAAALDAEATLEDAAWRLTRAQWSLGRRDTPRRQWPRQAAMLAASAASATYLIYRLFWTMNLSSTPAAVFSVVLLAAEFYAITSLGLYFFQVWRLVDPPLRRPTSNRTVDVFVATYNEDIALLRGTLTACLEMDYPHATYVLDDGARDNVRQLAESLGVRYISRTDRSHAKAGNLNNALRQTYGEFVVVLDADHLPYRHFITRLIGYFDDPRMGFVQAPHTTYNLDNFMGRWKSVSKAYWEDVRIFFEAVQLGKNRHNVACFCGSAAIFRRKAIEDVGLFATETITEDMHTGMRLNAAGWKSIAVGEEMVVGLAPDDAATFANQRLRWGEGNLSVLAYDNPLTMKGLTLAGRINHFASIACWTFGPARLILYLTPLAMLLTGVAPVADMSARYFAIVGLYLAAVWTAVKVASNGCGQLLGIETAMMASFHLQIQALWRAVFRRRRQKFVVTEKSRGDKKPASGLRRMWPQAALVALSVVAVSWAVSRVVFGISDDYPGLLIGGGLASYHAWLALVVLGRAASNRNSGEQWHHPLCLAVDYSIAGEAKTAVSVEFNENGCRLLTWERLGDQWPIRVTFHSPAGETVCHGRTIASTPLGRRKPFAYLNNIVFEHADPSQRNRESDSLRGMILRYVVPVVTMTHRLVRGGGRALPEELSGENDFPIPLTIDANEPNLPVQKSVAISMNRRGFLAALESPCPVGDVARITLSAPSGDVRAEVEVHDVETIRVGAAIVYQHEFHWRDRSPVRRMLSQKEHWKSALARTVSSLRDHRQPLARIILLQSAACLLAAATVFTYGKFYYRDIVLAVAARRPMTAVERGRAEVALERLAEPANVSADRLLRIYEAAAAIGDHARAADAAKRLANVPTGNRFGWTLTCARHLAQTNDHEAAEAAFDRVLAEPMPPSLSLNRQAEVYVEAARAAVAVNHLDKAVERFLQASNLRAADPEQAEELLGVLIADKRTKLAIQVLRQLERSDRVLRRIVDVYEMAEQPEQAVPELEELYRRHPDNADVVLRLAELAVVRRDFTAGLAYYRVLCRLEPDNADARAKLAETMLLVAREDVAARRFEQAGALFEESFRLQPPDEKLKREYGGFLAVAGHFDRAVAALEPLKDPESQMQLAAVLEMQGNRARALQILLGLERDRAFDKKIERSIARLLLAERRYEEAAARLVDLLKTSPNDSLLQREFLDAVAASNRWNNATRRTMLDVYRRCRENDFQRLDADGFQRLGDALRQLGMFEEAGVALRRAVTEFPEARRLRFRLAQTFGDLGHYDAAEIQYRTLLSARSRRSE